VHVRWFASPLLLVVGAACDIGAADDQRTIEAGAAEARLAVQHATAQLWPTTPESQTRGDLVLTRHVDGGVTATVAACNAPQGAIEWHLHAGTDCGNAGQNARGHLYLPDGKSEPGYQPIQVVADPTWGEGSGGGPTGGAVSFELGGMEQFSSLDPLNGKTVIFHGPGGARIACGVVQVAPSLSQPSGPGTPMVYCGPEPQN
jgi:Cu/Zn superoxide dismutase